MYARWIVFVFVISVLCNILYYFPILASGNNLGIQDWDQNFAWSEFTRVSLLNYHQFPFWNPYKCGGTAHFANPQIPVLSIQTLLVLLFGTITGIKLSIVVHGIIGFMGFYLLSRAYSLSVMSSVFAAIIFSFSGVTASFLSSGMVVFMNYAYAPYVLIYLLKSMNKKIWAVPAGILFAISFYAGYHITLVLGVFLVVYSIITAIQQKTLYPLHGLCLMSVTAGIVMLPKLILSAQLMTTFPRIISDESGYLFSSLFAFLVNSQQNLYGMTGITYVYDVAENSLYVGIIPFMFFIFFFTRMKNVQKHMNLLITLLIIVWFMLGSYVTPSIYDALHTLPIFSSFRVAQRFRFEFIIMFSIMAGIGLDNLGVFFRSVKIRGFTFSLIIIFIFLQLSVFAHNQFLSKTLVVLNPESESWQGRKFSQRLYNSADFSLVKANIFPLQTDDKYFLDPSSNEYLYLRQNTGVIECYDSLTDKKYAKGFDDEDYRGEYYIANPNSATTLTQSVWSPHKISFDVRPGDSSESDILILNQNYYPGWKVVLNENQCVDANNTQGLLSVNITERVRTVSFEYQPYSWLISRCQMQVL